MSGLQGSAEMPPRRMVDASARREPGSVRRRFGVAQALARPGFMTLRCVRENGQLIDFAWDFASGAVARLLCAGMVDLRGQRLSDVLNDRLARAEVFYRYRHVVELGGSDSFEHLLRLEDANDLCRHSVMRLGDGVAVTLLNRSAIARARQLEMEVRSSQPSHAAASARAASACGVLPNTWSHSGLVTP